MRPTELKETLKDMIGNKFPILIVGAPGIGKTDIVSQACRELDVDLIVSHPVVSDPTDYKGLPFPSKEGDTATFLPFGELVKLIKADKPTVFFLDDIGQAPSSVQAALMQLLLSRRINGHKVSDNVTFIAATNRRQDKAAVMGILEPVKSRFTSIVELEVNLEDWLIWAVKNDMPHELLSFLRFRPEHLTSFKATNDIVNTPSPRTIANVGKLMNAKVSNLRELIKGAAGEAFAIEFLAYIKNMEHLLSYEMIIASPEDVSIPDEGSLRYAMIGMLSHFAKQGDMDNLFLYTQRFPMEYQVLFYKSLDIIKPELLSHPSFGTWAANNTDILI